MHDIRYRSVRLRFSDNDNNYSTHKVTAIKTLLWDLLPLLTLTLPPVYIKQCGAAVRSTGSIRLVRASASEADPRWGSIPDNLIPCDYGENVFAVTCRQPSATKTAVIHNFTIIA